MFILCYHVILTQVCVCVWDGTAHVLYLSFSFGQGAAGIHFAEYSCHGNEDSLLQCGVNIHNAGSCSHDYDVGLSCSREFV